MILDVIITCYNEAHYIKHSLMSVIDQTLFHKINKVIIIDDGSSDNTKEILQPYVNSYSNIRYIYQENKGLAEARNTGIHESKADYIALLDADDIWLNNKIENQINVLKNYDVDLLYTSAYYFFEGSDTIYKLDPISFYGSGNLKEFFIKDAPIYPSTVIIKKNILNQVGYFDPFFLLAQDTDLWYRILAKGKVYHLNEYLIKRRRRMNALGEDIEKKIYFSKKATEKIIKLYPELKKYNSKKLSNIYFFEGRKYKSVNEYAKSIKSFSYSFIAKPPNFINKIIYTLKNKFLSN